MIERHDGYAQAPARAGVPVDDALACLGPPNAAAMGARAAELLFARLGGDRPPPRRLALRPTLLSRGSEAPP